MNSGDTPGPSLLNQALGTLRSLLGEKWTVTELPHAADAIPDADSMFAARVQIAPPDSSPYTELLISVWDKLSPRNVVDHIAPMVNVLRHAQSRHTVLMVAPWISPRTRQALRDRSIDYLDLTGNVSLSVTHPAIRLYTEGASQAPRTVQTAEAKKNITLAGPRAGRIVRFLTDVAPPHRASDIARTARVSAPWVSRLLGQLEDELLIRRDGRVITSVDWPGLLRARARSYDLLKHNPYVGMVAPNGIDAVLDKLRGISLPSSGKPSIAVTGPYAARTIAPLTSGGQLMLYVEHDPHTPDSWAKELSLLRVEEGAEVLLLRAHDDVVFEGHRTVEGITHVAPSQLVLDGLAGPGRMPAEAEAVLKAMIDDESWWRSSPPRD